METFYLGNIRGGKRGISRGKEEQERERTGKGSGREGVEGGGKWREGEEMVSWRDEEKKK